MRVLTALVALAALPFAAGMAQGSNPFSDPKNCGAHLNFSDKAAAHRADAALPHGGKHGVMDRPCASPDVPPPPPPPAPAPSCAVSAPAATGTLSIDGRVSEGAEPWGVLAGWCIELSGPVRATAMTDANGNYRFAGLPDGEYTICERLDLQPGWVQSFPTPAFGGVACPMGYGWTFSMVGWSASFVNFMNVAQ